MSDIETKQVFIVWINTDLTEGRGYQIPKAICESRATALRISRKADVQGTDGTVSEFQAVKHMNNWCAPFQLVKTTPADKKVQEDLDIKAAALQRARDAGLSDDDLKVLGFQP